MPSFTVTGKLLLFKSSGNKAAISSRTQSHNNLDGLSYPGRPLIQMLSSYPSRRRMPHFLKNRKIRFEFSHDQRTKKGRRKRRDKASGREKGRRRVREQRQFNSPSMPITVEE